MNEFYFYTYLIVGGFALSLLLAYLPRIIAYFGFLLPSEKLHNDVTNKMAILVPARNESAVIEPLLVSLSKQTYRAFEVFVIVKDPQDPTLAMVARYGFHAVIAPKQTCKSDALDAAVQSIFHQDKNKFDAYLILDADTMIKEDYLAAMNDAMASGRDVIVSKKIVKNYFMAKGSLTLQGAANGYIWTLFDPLGNKWKSHHHIALFTVGSGLLLSKKILLENGGWGYKSTMTEDCELAGDMIAHHWTSYYAENAPIYMEEAPTLESTNKRRQRWMSGLTEAQKLYRYKDFSIGHFWDVYFSYSIFISYLYFGFLAFYGVSNLITAFVFFLTGSALLPYPLYSGLAALGLIYLSFFAVGILVFLANRKDIKGHFFFQLATLFYFPIHYLGYFPIMLKVFLGRGGKGWDEIARVKEKEAK
jgi:cellulose synthase/poly-beta-1,6-N-acetylglucosamine synthase-like glycosyltransferase